VVNEVFSESAGRELVEKGRFGVAKDKQGAHFVVAFFRANVDCASRKEHLPEGKIDFGWKVGESVEGENIVDDETFGRF